MAATTYFFITPPIKNTAWQFWCFLTSQANTNVFQTTVALAAGDVTVFRDGVSLGNIDTLPVEIGATGCLLVELSADEMNGDEMTVIKFSDAADAEWQDAAFLVMPMEAVTVAQQADILSDATPFAGADIDQSLSTTESNIRGADNDDLEDISDQIDALNNPSAGAVADAVWDESSTAHNAASSFGAKVNEIADALSAPAGAIAFTYIVRDGDSEQLLDRVTVRISTDSAGHDIIWRGVTDSFGVARDTFNQLPRLDAGTYYFWSQRDGYTFTNPDTEAVS